MKTYLIAATLMAGFVTPALAEQFYVVLDPAIRKCEVMTEIPTGMKSMGSYDSLIAAKRAMALTQECL
jgi:hypothetical protein